MNPGYLSWVMICISLILLASGWKRVLLRHVADGAIILFFVAWCGLGRFQMEWRPGIAVYGAAILLAVFLVGISIRNRPMTRRLHLVSIGLFLASVDYLLKHLRDLDPLFMPVSPIAHAMVIAALAVMLTRKPVEQLGSISLGLLIANLLYAYLHSDRAPVQIGGLSFQDQWWVTTVTARVASAFLDYAFALTESAARSWNERRKAWRR